MFAINGKEGIVVQNGVRLGSALINSKEAYYNPLIEYKWNPTYRSHPSKIVNTGTNAVNATSYFGQGCYFDGISQRVDIAGTLRPNINKSSFSVSVNIVTNAATNNYLNFMGTADVKLMGSASTQLLWNCYSGVEHQLFYPNNLLMGLFTLTYDGTTYRAYHNGVLITSLVGANPIGSSNTLCIGGISAINSYRQATQKDMFIFNRVLTDVEVMKAYMYPNEFYMDAQADNLCILNMPMCEKDGYVRNYKTYTEVQKEYSDFNDGTTKGFTALYDATVANVSNKLKVTAVVNNPYTGKQYTAIVGNYYRIRCKMLKSSGSAVIIVGSTAGLAVSNLGSAGVSTNNVEQELIIICKATTTVLQCNARGASMVAGDYFTIDDWEVTDLGTSIYPIVNFTTACRTSAQRLTVGLQTSGFKRDSSGTILSKSNWLECDGVGYAGTGWNSVASKEKTIEYIVEKLPISSTNFMNIVIDGTDEKNLYSMFNIGTTNAIGTNINTNGYTLVTFDNVVHITIVLKTNGYELFKDGVSQGFKNTTGIISELTGVLIGTDRTYTKTLSSPIRLFKVHKKALSASQILANYNKYVAKGLLA